MNAAPLGPGPAAAVQARFRHILIVADIEGSSGCWSRRGSKFLNSEWARACREMSRDVAAVARALIEAGTETVLVKDFHRTGYNILPELLPPGVRLLSGYHSGPVPGMGDPGPAEAVMFLGLHAASGTQGFLAHTLTSRLASLLVNGKPMAEVELFSASLAPCGIRPVFFSGCPAACAQAEQAIPGILTYSLDKGRGPENLDAAQWRSGLAEAAVSALDNLRTSPYLPEGPFAAEITMRDGERAAAVLAGRWNLRSRGDRLFLQAGTIDELYMALIRLCYLRPGLEKVLEPSLFCYNLAGRLGLAWVRWRLNRPDAPRH